MVSNRFMRSAVVCAVAFTFFVFLFSCAKKMQSGSQGSQSGSVSPAASSVLKFANAEEELETWKKEPRYNDTLRYFISDGCTAGVVVADKKGFYAKEGLKVEGFKGKSDVEALGLGKADVAREIRDSRPKRHRSQSYNADNLITLENQEDKE